MKKTLLFFFFLSITLANAQVKIGENPSSIAVTSILELESSSKVLVITRVTTIEMEAIIPLPGALVYNEDDSCIFYYDGTSWNNLCAGGSSGNISWGAISGVLTDQSDLTAEFQKYVDLSTAQTIAGEKTLTEKFTVNTGNADDQIAEFLGRVKGEDGTAAEDFITRLQLDAVAAGGHTGTEGSIFFAGPTTQPVEDNANLIWDNTNKRLGIGVNTPNSPLHIAGAITKPIEFGVTGLNESHHTVLLDADVPVFLPDPTTCTGRVYIIKKRPGATITIPGGYLDTDSVSSTIMNGNILHLQSNGFGWEQIN